MKKIIICVSSVMVLLSSCIDGLLDTKPYDKYTEDLVWNNEKLAQGFIYNTQNSVLKEYYLTPLENKKFSGSANDDLSDNMIVFDNLADIPNIFRNVMSIDVDYGWDSFNLIREANIIIEKSSSSTELTESKKKEFVAQGKMLRAMIYYKKALLFGKYIKIDHVLDVDDEFQLPRTKTIKETYDFVINDLKDAAPNLPITATAGHLTQAAAYAMLAEVALQAASFAETGRDEYFDISKKASEDLFTLIPSEYELDEDYKRMFNDYEYALNSNEIILAWWKSKENTTFKTCHMLQNIVNLESNRVKDFATPKLVESFLGNGKRTPTLDLVNEYEVIDDDGIAKKWNETSYFKNFRPGVDYVSNVFFKNRDKRFYASIVYDSTMYFKNLVTMRDKGNLHYLSTSKKATLATQSGFWLRKTTYEEQQAQADKYTNAHLVVFRVGRSYLNYAEVLLRLNDIKGAINYINKTRTLHGGLPALSENMSAEEAWTAYKSERRVELFYENDRYWSLLRWGKYDGLDVIPELNKPHYRLEISSDGKSYEIQNLPAGTSHELNTKIFTERRYFFPIPQKEIILNEKLKGDQNPLW